MISTCSDYPRPGRLWRSPSDDERSPRRVRLRYRDDQRRLSAAGAGLPRPGDLLAVPAPRGRSATPAQAFPDPRHRLCRRPGRCTAGVWHSVVCQRLALPPEHRGSAGTRDSRLHPGGVRIRRDGRGAGRVLRSVAFPPPAQAVAPSVRGRRLRACFGGPVLDRDRRRGPSVRSGPEYPRVGGAGAAPDRTGGSSGMIARTVRRGWIAAAVGLAGCRLSQSVTDRALERMSEQPRYDVYEASRFFRDSMAMRVPPAGTVSRDALLNPQIASGRTGAGSYLQT